MIEHEPADVVVDAMQEGLHPDVVLIGPDLFYASAESRFLSCRCVPEQQSVPALVIFRCHPERLQVLEESFTRHASLDTWGFRRLCRCHH